MVKMNWKLWKSSFPFICDSCKELLWETRDICEKCGKRNTIRETLKIDYKLWKRKL